MLAVIIPLKLWFCNRFINIYCSFSDILSIFVLNFVPNCVQLLHFQLRHGEILLLNASFNFGKTADEFIACAGQGKLRVNPCLSAYVDNGEKKVAQLLGNALAVA